MRPLLLSLTLGLASLGSAKERPGDPAKGKVVFEQCTACHNAGSADKKMGPGLKGLFQKPKLQNGKKPTEPNVRARIDAGGGGMPPFKEMLTDQEKNDLIAYLKTL
jgi:cytochrome c2